MSSITSERTVARKPRDKESRQPDFVVRAKTGPGRNDWSTLGYAWARESGEGFSVKLNAMPIGTTWNGILKLLPPFVSEDDIPDEDRV